MKRLLLPAGALVLVLAGCGAGASAPQPKVAWTWPLETRRGLTPDMRVETGGLLLGIRFGA